MNNPPKFVYVILIATTPEKLWAALTNPDFTSQYFFGTRVESDWKVGSRFIFRGPQMITDEGTVLRCEPPHVLSYTFQHLRDEEMRKEPPSRVTFEIESLEGKTTGLSGPVVRLTVTHDDFQPESKLFHTISNGWPAILSALKTVLETGQPINLQKH